MTTQKDHTEPFDIERWFSYPNRRPGDGIDFGTKKANRDKNGFLGAIPKVNGYQALSLYWQPRLKTASFAVLGTIYTLTLSNGRFFREISIATLMERTGLSNRTVIDATADLENQGMIKRADCPGQTTVWGIALDKVFAGATIPTQGDVACHRMFELQKTTKSRPRQPKADPVTGADFSQVTGQAYEESSQAMSQPVKNLHPPGSPYNNKNYNNQRSNNYPVGASASGVLALSENSSGRNEEKIEEISTVSVSGQNEEKIQEISPIDNLKSETLTPQPVFAPLPSKLDEMKALGERAEAIWEKAFRETYPETSYMPWRACDRINIARRCSQMGKVQKELVLEALDLAPREWQAINHKKFKRGRRPETPSIGWFITCLETYLDVVKTNALNAQLENGKMDRERQLWWFGLSSEERAAELAKEKFLVISRREQASAVQDARAHEIAAMAEREAAERMRDEAARLAVAARAMQPKAEEMPKGKSLPDAVDVSTIKPFVFPVVEGTGKPKGRRGAAKCCPKGAATTPAAPADFDPGSIKPFAFPPWGEARSA